MSVAVPIFFALAKTSSLVASALPSFPLVLPQGWLSVWLIPEMSGHGWDGLRLADVVLEVLPVSLALEVRVRAMPFDPVIARLDADCTGSETVWKSRPG